MTDFVIAMGGDAMLGRSFRDLPPSVALEQVYDKALQQAMQSADFALVNLETTITDRGTPDEQSTFHFRMRPRHAKTFLADLGVDHVSLANNHALDYGAVGLRDTLATLDRLGIGHSGAGSSLADASALRVHRDAATGLTIGVLSASDHFKRWAATAAGENGIHYIDTDSKRDRQKLTQLVAKAAQRVDLLIVSMHWGSNWQTMGAPPANMQTLGRMLVHAGADIVHGHSAHHVQPYEKVRRTNNSVGYIFYSLGAFIDDYRVSAKYKSDVGALALVYVNPRTKQVTRATLKAVQVDSHRLRAALAPDYDAFVDKQI